ncbi:MAG TPA: septal ring lytic transglycosylase RlpA family protein [Bacteroidota bacterium]
MTNCSAIVWLSGAVLCMMVLGCVSTPRFAEKEEHDRADTGRTQKAVAVRDDPPARVASGKVLLTLEGTVSYYAHDFQGKQTSNGETFDMNDLTAAHRTFPFGTKVRVTNLENKKSVIVRVNDRGPFVEGRIMDLSMGAAKEIGLIQNGTVTARLEVLQWGDGK